MPSLVLLFCHLLFWSVSLEVCLFCYCTRYYYYQIFSVYWSWQCIHYISDVQKDTSYFFTPDDILTRALVNFWISCTSNRSWWKFGSTRPGPLLDWTHHDAVLTLLQPSAAGMKASCKVASSAVPQGHKLPSFCYCSRWVLNEPNYRSYWCNTWHLLSTQ